LKSFSDDATSSTKVEEFFSRSVVCWLLIAMFETVIDNFSLLQKLAYHSTGDHCASYIEAGGTIPQRQCPGLLPHTPENSSKLWQRKKAFSKTRPDWQSGSNLYHPAGKLGKGRRVGSACGDRPSGGFTAKASPDNVKSATAHLDQLRARPTPLAQ
jgi:hypothetical protein